MRRLTRIGLTLVVLAACLVSGAELWAKGGRGGSRGGGGFKDGSRGFKGSRGFRRSDKSPAGDKHAPGHGLKRSLATEKLTVSDRPWSKHHAREQRKLDHRRQVADHLRELSDRNGNEQLKQVADDMERRAQQHYDKQMEKINQKYGLDDFVDTAADSDHLGHAADDPSLVDSDIADGADNLLDEGARKLTGRENALFQQIRNEQRKLTQRMEAVERMRQLAEQIGDAEMLQAADALEQWATNHFDKRMAQITDFQQRHDLPDIRP